MVHGIQGFLQEELVNLDEYLDSDMGLEILKRTPSAFLGTCRFKMPAIEGNENLYEEVFRIMEKYDLDASKARDLCVKKDKQRQCYYNYYSSKKWGRADSYDLCINSSILGVEGTAKLLIQYIEDFEARNN